MIAKTLSNELINENKPASKNRLGVWFEHEMY